MKIILKVVQKFIAIFLILSPSLSYANWQYTKWGMTVEEVVQASNGSANPDPKTNAHSSSASESLLVAPFRAGFFEFEANFLFDRRSRTLSVVNLKLKDPNPQQCSSLRQELNSKYGPPQSRGSIAVTWRDETANNGIAFLDFGKSCDIQYRALRGQINKNL